MSEKIKLQDGMDDSGELNESARAYNRKLQAQCQSLLGSLYMLIRNVKLYAPDNAIFTNPLDQLRECINTILAMEGSLSLQAAGDSFYLNNMLVRMDLKSIDNVRLLREEFETRNVGGFQLQQPVTTSELQDFIFIFSPANQETAGEQGVSARKLQALKLRRFEKLQEIFSAKTGAEDTGATDQRLDRKRYALVVYARLIHFMQRYLEGLQGQGPQLSPFKALHLLQDLVDVCQGHNTHFLGLTSRRVDEQALIHHLVNVAVLSIIFGIHLGLDKEQLRDLGMCALLHDLGKLDLTDQLLLKADKRTPHEARLLQQVPILTVLRLLRLRALNRTTIQTILASIDHKIDYGKPIRDLQGNVIMVEKQADLGVFPRMLALTDTYSMLTGLRGISPELTLVIMNSELKHRFDQELLVFFQQMMQGVTSRTLKDGDRFSFF